MNKAVKIIAFYLPQYHPFKENDEWWGKGFTEWTNVGKAKPLFKGHYQPKIPADLGYYDLRVPETREEQARLAKESGIYGFCYWHYWFNGHELMERPWNEVVSSGRPDFPFCIGWANESWERKMWNKDGSIAGGKTLIEQTYGGEKDAKAHFFKLLSAFKDHRYILVDGAPLVFVHRALDLPQQVIIIWNQLATKEGFSGVHFVGRLTYEESLNPSNMKELKERGFNALTIGRLGTSLYNQSRWIKLKRHMLSVFKYGGCPRVVDYNVDASSFFDEKVDSLENIYPSIVANWDHSPRSGKKGLILVGCTPQKFEYHLKRMLKIISSKNEEHRICFIKSWNEWGEGNYLEPDRKYGMGWLQAVKKAIDSL